MKADVTGSTPIRILMLEDNALDAELIGAQLRQHGLEAEIERVWTREAFVAALVAGNADLILADHVLPNFDGDSALLIATQLAPELPFIFVSGTLTEELAVRALRRGARDYVVKQRLQRLPDAILRALREQEDARKLLAAQTELEARHETLACYANALPPLIVQLDGQWRIGFGNDAFESWYGIGGDAVAEQHLADVVGTASADLIRSRIVQLGEDQTSSFEVQLFDKDGQARPVQIDYVPLLSMAAGVAGAYLVARDISGKRSLEASLLSQKATLERQVQMGERELSRSQSQLRSIFESSNQHQILLSTRAQVADANEASLAAILKTKADVLGADIAETPWFAGNPEISAVVADATESALSGKEVRQEFELNLATGLRSFSYSFRPIFGDDGAVDSVLCEAVETTDRRRAEHALHQAQKIEAVGQLTGGIAHDFNNILTIIQGNIDFALVLMDAPGNNERARRALENAMKGVASAATLTSRLLTVARKQPLKAQVTDLNAQVAGTREMLGRSLGELIELDVSVSSSPLAVEIDPTQFEAALINLAVNARDAMPGGGRLTIEVSDIHMDSDLAAQHMNIPAARYAMLRVSDNGMGMSSETLSHVFEPFFTTKEVGKGTGLGLSMVYGFVKQSGGHILIDSKVGAGTTFSILFPISPVTLDAAQVDDPRARLQGDGGAAILVAEDNEDVRAYTVEVLRQMGYRVLEAHDGLSAVRLLEREDVRVDLLLSDIVMPRMSGWELARQARRLRPELPVLFTSGYPRDIESSGADVKGVKILAKPFTRRDLAGAVQTSLQPSQVAAPA